MTGGLADGLAYLPHWLGGSADLALETAVSDWVRHSGWSAAGLVWPIQDTPKVALHSTADQAVTLTSVPSEMDEVVRSLGSKQKTVIWQLPGSASRLYTLLTPPGLPAGVLWAERNSREPWKEADRNYVSLSASLLEQSAVFGRRIGPIIDPNRLEERLKDAAVIARRMAHDFDNILTGILGFSDLTVPLLPPGSQPAKYVAEIAKVGARGITFTQQLHQLSRSAQVNPLAGSIRMVLDKEQQRMSTLFPKGVTLTVNVPQNLASVAMESGPLQTVLGHLLENAAEASPTNAQIAVTARIVELSSGEARGYLGQVTPSQYAEVTIRDHGTGIKPEVRARLFLEPFYTTKIRHRGLGLAIVYRVLFAHRGGIRIDAATPPELGTVVRVVIPLASARPVVAATAAGTPALGV